MKNYVKFSHFISGEKHSVLVKCSFFNKFTDAVINKTIQRKYPRAFSEQQSISKLKKKNPSPGNVGEWAGHQVKQNFRRRPDFFLCKIFMQYLMVR